MQVFFYHSKLASTVVIVSGLWHGGVNMLVLNTVESPEYSSCWFDYCSKKKPRSRYKLNIFTTSLYLDSPVAYLSLSSRIETTIPHPPPFLFFLPAEKVSFRSSQWILIHVTTALRSPCNSWPGVTVTYDKTGSVPTYLTSPLFAIWSVHSLLDLALHKLLGILGPPSLVLHLYSVGDSLYSIGRVSVADQCV